MTDFDLSAYLGVFLDEIDEQLQILDTEILLLEKDPSNKKTIQNIFRAAHTLKGSSSSMGIEKMKELTHHLENIFEQIRQNKLQVTPELIDILLESIDLLKQLKQSIVEGTLDEINITPYITKIEQFSEKKQPSLKQKKDYRFDDYQKKILLEGLELGHHAFEIHVHIEKESLMKSVRAFLIHNTIDKLGEIIATFPCVEEIEDEESFQGDMVLIVLTMSTKDEIVESINQISNIEKVKVYEIHKQAILNENMIDHEQEQLNKTKRVKSQEKAVHQKAKISSIVRVDVDRLEHLMNLVGELVIDQTRLVDVRGRFAQKGMSSESEYEVLDDVTNHLNRIIAELQEGMMKIRMLPIEQLFNRFPRMVRDIAMKTNKKIEFIMEGKETELDRTLIEEISDPIIHLLRNAIDHGIECPEERKRLGKQESGRIVLRASHEENHIVISISDDGKGIDPEKIKKISVEKGVITEEEAQKLTDQDAIFLIFHSGISTAKKVTDISGRGVGMDIVKSHIEKLNGLIDIKSTVGEGTTFTIKLPLTLAIIRSLLVNFGDKTFAIPLVNVLEIIRLNKSDIQLVNDQEVGMVRGRVLPLVRLKERLGLAEENENYAPKKREFVVVVGIADKRIGIIADKTIGNQEVVIKSLGTYIGSPPFVSGATVMGDGSVALILDISSLVHEHGTQIQEQMETVKTDMEEEIQLVTFKLDTEEYGIEIQKIKDIITLPALTKVVETPDYLLGLINLRGNMLPVIDLRKKFQLPDRTLTKKSRVIVVENGTKDIGFLVDEVTQVLKINQLSIEKAQNEDFYNHSQLIKGISKLENRVVLILNTDEILCSIQGEIS